MGWNEFRARRTLLADVLTTAAATHHGSLPWSSGLAAAFSSPEDLLLEIQLRWFQHLSGAVEQELCERGPDETLVVRAWHRASSTLPGARVVLDAHRGLPVLRVPQERERLLLGHRCPAAVPA